MSEINETENIACVFDLRMKYSRQKMIKNHLTKIDGEVQLVCHISEKNPHKMTQTRCCPRIFHNAKVNIENYYVSQRDLYGEFVQVLP